VAKSEAAVIAGTLVGTLQLGRTLGSQAEGKAFLAAARRALIDHYDAG
jgi:TetR/AcrR family transcriptional repressor of nem operon